MGPLDWESSTLTDTFNKSDIFNKSAFANRKLIAIYLMFFFFSVVYLSLTLDSPLDNHLGPKA